MRILTVRNRRRWKGAGFAKPAHRHVRRITGCAPGSGAKGNPMTSVRVHSGGFSQFSRRAFNSFAAAVIACDRPSDSHLLPITSYLLPLISWLSFAWGGYGLYVSAESLAPWGGDARRDAITQRPLIQRHKDTKKKSAEQERKSGTRARNGLEARWGVCYSSKQSFQQ